MGGIYGCDCKEVYRFPCIISLFLLYLFFFAAAASLFFVHFKNIFRSCYTYTPILVPLQSTLVMRGPPRDGS